MQARKNSINQIFKKTYHSDPDLFVIAPSRINIIGEHIDYLGGNVFPANINLYMYGAFAKSDTINFFSANFASSGIKSYEILDKFIFDKEYGFMNYVLGCYEILKEQGYKIGGFSVVVNSEIPSSSGLSSSAAFGVLVLKGLTSLYGYDVDGTTIAKLFKIVENKFMNLKNGIMDQFIIANGKQDHIMLLDTSSLEFKNYKIHLGDYNFLVINSKKPRNLIDSKYNERVEETQKALNIINQKHNFKNLCEIPYSEKDSILSLISDPLIYKRANYAIEEQKRVKDLIDAVDTNDYQKIGQILNQGHKGLSQDYSVSCEELDFINEQGNKLEGVLGIRMTGAGFGGCLIALVKKSENKNFRKNIVALHKEKFGYECEVYDVEVVDGVKILK